MEDNKYKKQFPIKFKKHESTEVLEFANMQTNFQDTVRYLIEKEIAENGIRNLQEFIPPVRDKNYFKNLKPGTVSKLDQPQFTASLESKKEIKEIPKCYE